MLLCLCYFPSAFRCPSTRLAESIMHPERLSNAGISLNVVERAIGMHDIHDPVVLAESLAFVVCETFTSNLQEHVVL